MPQINLLKQNSKTENMTSVFATGVSRVLIVVLFALACYYGWVFFQINRVNKDIVSVEQDIAHESESIVNANGKQELFVRQAQLKEITHIIQKHPYWTALFPALAKATLKTANYVSLEALQDGNMSLNVIVPDMTQLDKFLQVFDRPEFYKNFSDVRIGSISNVQQSGKIAYKFQIKFKFNADLLQYLAK